MCEKCKIIKRHGKVMVISEEQAASGLRPQNTITSDNHIPRGTEVPSGGTKPPPDGAGKSSKGMIAKDGTYSRR